MSAHNSPNTTRQQTHKIIHKNANDNSNSTITQIVTFNECIFQNKQTSSTINTPVQHFRLRVYDHSNSNPTDTYDTKRRKL